MKVSIVVPVYKGKKYIQRIIRQVEECSKHVSSVDVELLLINDCPDEILEDYYSNVVSVRTYNTDINRGIHGSRVKGCNLCEGEYILLLDQDDTISAEYLESQLTNIQKTKADASICRVKEDGRYTYNNTNPFERVLDVNYMTGVGNAIVSPGQVLIRKDAIPHIWKTHILEHNGADDWFLWLCMLGEQKKFVLNDDILFEHVIDGDNTSWNSEEMILSEKDMCDMICKANLFESSLTESLQKLISGETFRYIHLLEKYRNMFFLYDKWMRLESKNGDISKFLFNQGFKTVAVYGAGYIGKQLVQKLQNTKVCIAGLIDVNADYIKTDFFVSKLDDFKYSVDLVILTQIQDVAEIKCDIKKIMDVTVISIQELLQIWEQKEGELGE